MERDELIIRKAPPGDRRAVQVYMTEKGKVFQKRIVSEFASIDDEALQGLSEAEKKHLCTLKTVYQNLQK